MDKLITIGKITKNQGNKGDIRVLPLTDYPERFKLLEKVYLVKNNDIKEKVIDNVWFHKQFVILKFKDINQLQDIFPLKNYFVKIKENDLLPLDNNQYYIYKLLNYTVKTARGKQIGYLKEVLNTGGTDIFVVKGKDKQYMIPASKDIISNIDKKNETIIIKPIPGLLDL